MLLQLDHFRLGSDKDITLQHQIKRMIVDGILTGRFRPGDRLPSSRGLSRHLGISRITVTLAYADLVADDYLTSEGRRGYFVSEGAPSAAPALPPADQSEASVDWARILGPRRSSSPTIDRPRDWQNYPYPFIYGQTDRKLFDQGAWRACALMALGQRDFEALTADRYDSDDPELVENLLRHILTRRGIRATPDEILITLGAQNALWIAAHLVLTQRRTAAVENPCYPGLRDILAQTRCRIAPVDVDANGLPPRDLPEGIDAVFVTPSHHCPTNATLPIDRRQTLLHMAAERGFVVVEDDYEFEMAFHRAPSPSLKSLDRAGLVIHVGSFSKSLFPGLRLGYVVASAPFIAEARTVRATLLRHPPGHLQRTAAYFLSLGHYDAQVNRMRKTFARRRDVMRAAIDDQGLILGAGVADGGSSFWMAAPKGTDTVDLARGLHADGVVIEPGQSFFAGSDAPRNFYRLAYSSIPSSRIPDGIQKIAAAISRAA
ncbi:MAG: PLP-dependent aminotransferase family protein [Pseudomonadota bacterium]